MRAAARFPWKLFFVLVVIAVFGAAGVVFGMVATIVPCTLGSRTRGGTEGIATSTTAAVVWSFILILVFDFLIVRLSFAL